MIPWRLFPFVRVIIAFIFGVLLERFLPNWFISFTIIGLLSVFYIIFSEVIFPSNSVKPQISSFCILIIFLSAGYIRTVINIPGFEVSHFIHKMEEYDGGIAIIQEIPIKRTSLRTELRIINLCNSANKNCISTSGNAIVYFKLNDTVAQYYKPGDKIYFLGKLKEIGANTNPYSFDFKLYLYNRGITHQVYIWGEKNHTLLEKDCLSFIYQKAMKVRDEFVAILRKYDKNDERFAVSSAMILGYKNLVSEDMYKAFSDSGAVHILAVSGMHLGVLATALAFILDKWKTKRKLFNAFKYIFVLGILWFFAFITGAAPAMVRAAIMFTFILYAKYFKPATNFYNVLAVCGILMLLYDPFMIYQASFQFSFLAILSLVYFQPYIKNWYTPHNFITKVIWELTSVAIAAQILVGPITIYFFHKFPLYFIITGVISVWLSTLALYSGMMLFIFEYMCSPINILLSKIFLLLMDLFIESVRIVKEIPLCSIDGLVLSEIELIIVYGILLMLMLYLINRKFYLIKSMLVLIAILWLNFGYRIHCANHQLLITIYDNRSYNQIEIFDGRTAYDIRFDTIDTGTMAINTFINQNNRIYHNINSVRELNQSSEFIGSNCRKKNEIIQIKDKMLLILNQKSTEIDLIKYDFIFLTENIKWAKEIRLKKNSILIVDRKMDQDNLEFWKEKADLWDVQLHSIKHDGSITIKI